MKNIRKKILTFAAVLVVLASACTDLEPKLYSEVTPENFPRTADQFVSSMGASYQALQVMGNHASIWSCNELASDELVVTTKGGDWFDGGVLIDIHRHQYKADNGFFNNAWSAIYGGISTTNRLLYQFGIERDKGNEVADAFIAELRGVRALWYYWALDAFGNVPLSLDFTDTRPPANNADFDQGRIEVYNFIESELNEILPLLESTSNVRTYGRFNQAAATALRCKLYLNAETYTGTPQWEKAAADAKTLMDGTLGVFNLSLLYSNNFVPDNDIKSSENIFVVPYDKVFGTGFNWAAMTLHYASRGTYEFTFQPWNGYSVVEEFYNSYIDPDQNPGPQGPVWTGLAEFDPTDDRTPNGTGTQDSRLSNFIVGPQFNSDGTPTEDGSVEGEDSDAPDPDGKRLNFTPQINMLHPNGWRQGGARIGKYAYELGNTENASNDFVIFRLADIMLTRAEALWRLNPSDGEALSLVNEIRTRAGVDPFTELNAENLLAERGREMFAEMTRRQDLIRFGKWGDAWWEKDGYVQEGSPYVVFPIPQPQLDVSADLKQNPGFN
jgi:hypothetical protein